MGYLNNSTRTLDAILTKKGREILSSGGDFEVTKFALGDDEIDYALWDTTHTQGTDYYGAVIDNLPALEPFNDPTEIMKYKLVTRQEGTRAMVKLQDTSTDTTATALAALKWYSAEGSNFSNRVTVAPEGMASNKVGTDPTTLTLSYLANGDDCLDLGQLDDETFTITLLDASVAVMAPPFETTSIPQQGSRDYINAEGNLNGGMSGNDHFWLPFVDNVQHISQTVSGVSKVSGGQLTFDANGTQAVYIYTKQVAASTKTSVVITGEKSGAVIEFPITITLAAGPS
jgi:hypothetical protein